MNHLPQPETPATATDWHALVDVETGEPPTHATRFRLRLEPRCLHLEIEAACDLLWSPHTRRNAPIYEADALEVFLDPLGGGRVYRELEVAPTGAIFDAWILNGTDLERPDAPRDLHTAFAREAVGSPRVEVRIDGRAPTSSDVVALRDGLRAELWSVRWTLPFAGVPASGSLPLLSPPVSWRLNVFRIQHHGPGTRPALQAWRPTGRRDFHRPEAFGPLA